MIRVALSLGWPLALLCLFLLVLRNLKKSWIPKNPWLLLILIGLFVRLVPAFVLAPGSNYDLESYAIVSKHVLALENVYTSPDAAGRHPYLPLQLYWIGFASWFSSRTNLPFDSMVRLSPIVFDVLISLGIFYILQSYKGTINPFLGSLLYGINPLSVYVSAYHGQFDALPMFCILLGLYQGGKSATKTGFWLSLGILVKSWPILAFPSAWQAFSKLKQRIVLIAFVAFIPMVGILFYSLVFHASILPIIKQAVTYNHGVGIWGYTYLLRVLGFTSKTVQFLVNHYLSLSRFITIAVLVFVWFAAAKFESPYAGFLTILVSFFAFTHAFSIQYLVWLLPFAILVGDWKWLKWYTMASFAYMFLAYHTLILNSNITNLLPLPLADWVIIMPSGLPAWLVTVAWSIRRIQNARGFSGAINPIGWAAPGPP
jgi:hypothetical protein